VRIVDHSIMTGAQGFSATDAELGFLNANDFIPRLAFGEDDLRRCRRRRRVIACMRQLRDTRAIIYMVACKSDGLIAIPTEIMSLSQADQFLRIGPHWLPN
jgi:hypothetical protein